MHALNTEGYALCLDLPAAARSGPAAAGEWGLTLAPGDRTLYAANPALGLVVEIGVGDNPGIRRTARIPRGAIGAAPRLAVAPDGGTLYVPTAGGVIAVDTSSLAVRRTLLRGRRVSAVVARGRRLYAQDGAVVTLDAASGAVLRRTPTSAPPAALAAVVPAARAVVRAALEALRGAHCRIEEGGWRRSGRPRCSWCARCPARSPAAIPPRFATRRAARRRGGRD